jgi:hypothetical protein
MRTESQPPWRIFSSSPFPDRGPSDGRSRARTAKGSSRDDLGSVQFDRPVCRLVVAGPRLAPVRSPSLPILIPPHTVCNGRRAELVPTEPSGGGSTAGGGREDAGQQLGYSGHLGGSGSPQRLCARSRWCRQASARSEDKLPLLLNPDPTLPGRGYHKSHPRAGTLLRHIRWPHAILDQTLPN